MRAETYMYSVSGAPASEWRRAKCGTHTASRTFTSILPRQWFASVRTLYAWRMRPAGCQPNPSRNVYLRNDGINFESIPVKPIFRVEFFKSSLIDFGPKWKLGLRQRIPRIKLMRPLTLESNATESMTTGTTENGSDDERHIQFGRNRKKRFINFRLNFTFACDRLLPLLRLTAFFRLNFFKHSLSKFKMHGECLSAAGTTPNSRRMNENK